MMRLTCPACRKPNEIAGLTEATCSRCGCDLACLCAVQLAAARSQLAAASALRLRDWPAALEQAERSWSFRNTPDAARLAALACVALGQVEALLTWRRRASVAGIQQPG
jgi:hypothetical protein